MAHCSRCGSTNVDFEGYCWTCEYQAPAAEPPAHAVSPVAQPVAVEAPPRRSAGARALVAVALVAVAIVSAGVSLVVVTVFRSNAESIAAQSNAVPLASPVVTATTVAAAGADPEAACVAGVWKTIKAEGDYQYTNLGTVHVSGTGGGILFRADGTGTWDVNGYTEAGTIQGKRVVATASGTVDFRYTIAGPLIYYQDVVSNAKLSLAVDGAGAGSAPVKMVGSDSTRYTCGGNTLTLDTGEATIELVRTG